MIGRSRSRAAEQLDQVEQAAVGPVDVLEDEQHRLVARDRLDEAAHREEQRLAVVDRRLGVEPEQDRRGGAATVVGVGPAGRSATCSRSFASATSGGSLSKIPQSCLTCIAKAK